MHAMRFAGNGWHAMVVAGLFLVLLGTGCAGIGTIRGQLLDAQTKQPIGGAVVLGVWTKREGFIFHRTELVGAKEVETDAQGRFELVRPGALGVDESVTVYKFGYIAWNNELVFPTYESRKDRGVPDQILLELFPSGGDHSRHASFVRAITMGVGPTSEAPRFWKAFRPEDLMR